MDNISFDAIIKNLPDILVYIVPGFLFAAIFRYFTSQKLNGLFLWVESAAISFVSLSTIQILVRSQLAIWTLCFLSSALCIVAALAAAKCYKSQWFDAFCDKYYHIEKRDSVLHASVNWREPTVAFVCLKGKSGCYAGYVLFISNQDDPQQWICLDNPMQFDDARECIWPEGGQDASIGRRLTIKLEDVQCIEFAPAN